jgi:hypothetical protein
MKVDNESLIRARDEQPEKNAVLMQSLSEIQKNLQQGLSNAKLQQLERLKTPSNSQKHGLAHSNVGNSSSKKRHQNVKKGKSGGSISTDSSNRNIYFEEFSNSDTGLSIPRKRKRHSESSLTGEFKKAKLPTFDGEI